MVPISDRKEAQSTYVSMATHGSPGSSQPGVSFPSEQGSLTLYCFPQDFTSVLAGRDVITGKESLEDRLVWFEEVDPCFLHSSPPSPPQHLTHTHTHTHTRTRTRTRTHTQPPWTSSGHMALGYLEL